MAATVLKIKPEPHKKNYFTNGFENIVEESIKCNGSWGLPQNDILFAVTFWLMTECGFAVKSEDDAISKRGLPDNWKHKTKELYEAKFILPPYKEHLVHLVALPADDILCINVFVSNVSCKNMSLKSLAISSSGFVPRPKANHVLAKFSNLDYIRIYLRSSLIWPIRCAILTDQGISNGSLIGLSDEIKLKIVHLLELQDLLSLSETCHDLHRVCNDQALWKTLFHRHYRNMCSCVGKLDCEEAGAQWKENYKHCYKMKTPAQNSQSSSLDSFHTASENAYYESDLPYD